MYEQGNRGATMFYNLKNSHLNICNVGYRQEADDGAERISDGVSSEHKSSRECQSTGTAWEERSLAVYAEATNSRETCVTSVPEGHEERLETLGSDSEVKF